MKKLKSTKKKWKRKKPSKKVGRKPRFVHIPVCPTCGAKTRLVRTKFVEKSVCLKCKGIAATNSRE